MTAMRHEITVPAEAASLKQVRAFLRELLPPLVGEECENIVLALDEAAANIIRHRDPEITDGEIHLRVESDPAVLRFQFDAFCRTSEMGRVKPRDLADIRPGGLGMHFINSMMDRVYFIPDRGHPGSVTLVLEKQLVRANPTDAKPTPPEPNTDA